MIIINPIQYKAFGVKDYAYKERLQATGYIGKEKDTEMNLAEHGVRKYDSDLGRFLCPDKMWEKYISYTPYQYAGNDPINKVDWNGKFWDIVLDVGFIAYDLYDIGKSLVKGKPVTGTQVEALVADIGCAAAPFVAGGCLVVRATSKADDAVDAVKAMDKMIDTKKVVQKVESRKLTDNELIEHFGKKFHEPGNKKDKYKRKFAEQLKKNGDKNFDFYIDKNNDDILLKGNKSGKTVNTGDKFK